jgi:hypothetical protein
MQYLKVPNIEINNHVLLPAERDAGIVWTTDTCAAQGDMIQYMLEIAVLRDNLMHTQAKENQNDTGSLW